MKADRRCHICHHPGYFFKDRVSSLAKLKRQRRMTKENSDCLVHDRKDHPPIFG